MQGKGICEDVINPKNKNAVNPSKKTIGLQRRVREDKDNYNHEDKEGD